MSSPVQLPGLTDLEEIGRGGYGVVYRAWQTQLRRPVAIKVLSVRFDEHAARRFAQECRALGSVSGHPNIVAVYDAGTTPEKQSYLVMPLYENGSLLDRINRSGPLPWPEAVEIGVTLAGALQTAHQAGILHRDIKPANVLVDSYGAAHLADFGQARHDTDDRTRTGGVVATPGFSAPEILHGDQATARSDVFSLAATVMGLILGKGPFAADTDENIAALLLRVVSIPAPDLRGRGVPDEVCRALEAAMDKRPSQRPESAEAFGSALQNAQRAVGLGVTPMIIAGRVARSGGVSQPTAPAGPSTGPPTAATVHPPNPGGSSGSGGSGGLSGLSGPTVMSGHPPPSYPPPSYPPPSYPPPSYPPPSYPPPSYPPPSYPPAPSGRSGRRRILAAVAAIVLVAAAGGVAVVLSQSGKGTNASSSSAPTSSAGTGGAKSSSSSPLAVPTPINAAAPGALLLTGADPVLSGWGKPAESNPSAPGEWSMFWDLLGTQPDSAVNLSAVPTCLGLPTLPAGSQKNVSDIYYATTAGYSQPGRYLVVQSIGFVMGTDALARQMVDPWRTKLSACQRDVQFGSSYDDFAWVNHDKSVQPAAGAPLAPAVVVSRPALAVAVPAVVDQSSYRIRFELVDKPEYTEISPRYFDLIALSAGTSVVYLALQSNGDPPAEAVRVAAVQALLKKLVA